MYSGRGRYLSDMPGMYHASDQEPSDGWQRLFRTQPWSVAECILLLLVVVVVVVSWIAIGSDGGGGDHTLPSKKEREEKGTA
jgi:hypothetical protein